MTTEMIQQGLAKMKNVKPAEITNIDTAAGTFELGASIYSFDLTPSGKSIKTGSVKYFTTKTAYNNCSY